MAAGIAVAVHGLLALTLMSAGGGVQGGTGQGVAAISVTLVNPAMLGGRSGGAGGSSAAGEGQKPTLGKTAAPPEPPNPGDGQTSRAKAEGGETAAVAQDQRAGTSAYQGLAGADMGGLGLFDTHNYQGVLERHIRPFRVYPSEAITRRSEGMTVVRFRVDQDGQVLEAWVVRRSRDPSLDRAALETLWRAEPMPPPPAGIRTPVEVELPIPFRLVRS